jgi:plastocyanin
MADKTVTIDAKCNAHPDRITVDPGDQITFEPENDEQQDFTITFGDSPFAQGQSQFHKHGKGMIHPNKHGEHKYTVSCPNCTNDPTIIVR